MLSDRIKNSIQFRYSAYLYARLSRTAVYPEFGEACLSEQGYYSQCGQDKWLLEEVFKNRNSGVFIDIGAHDGVSFSNTLRMEELGWCGLAVEPMPEVFTELQRNRKCVLVNGCITDQSGSFTFRRIRGYAEMLSGLVEEYDERHVQRIEHEIAQYGGSYTDLPMTCFRLDELCQEHSLHEIDYLDIDVEGAELCVLKSIDFDALNIWVIGVENNYRDHRIPLFPARRGFILHSILGDEIYVNRKAIRRGKVAV